MLMQTIDPAKVTIPQLQNYLQGIVVPRPVALVSTIDKTGNVNLSPFSFFNLFSINPPIVVFSPSRRGRDNTIKHTYENILEVPEAVINIVSYAMVQQVSLASTEYPKGVNEFVKSGLTPFNSILIKPPRVKESPASLECTVKQVIPLGDQGGAGNLVLCEIVLIHIKDEMLDANNYVDPFKLDAVARMGNDWYSRAHGDSIFKVPKPLLKKGIGVDQIPEAIRNSKILTGNDLGLLGNVENIPDEVSIAEFKKSSLVINALKDEDAIHHLAQEYLKEEKVEEAWKILLAFYKIK
jgi:flavin reductase (DIM6/NTAB) family NADH-FMN oxidoreductase RutF